MEAKMREVWEGEDDVLFHKTVTELHDAGIEIPFFKTMVDVYVHFSKEKLHPRLLSLMNQEFEHTLVAVKSAIVADNLFVANLLIGGFSRREQRKVLRFLFENGTVRCVKFFVNLIKTNNDIFLATSNNMDKINLARHYNRRENLTFEHVKGLQPKLHPKLKKVFKVKV